MGNFRRKLRELERSKADWDHEQVLLDDEATATWICLQKDYTNLILNNLSEVLENRLEQQLWNDLFKWPITAAQNRCAKGNSGQTNDNTIYLVLLESSAGFFLSLLRQIVDAFDLDLPFLKHAVHFGLLNRLSPKKARRPPEDTASRPASQRRLLEYYMCQFCLVHLGDLARYSKDASEADAYYNYAVLLIPSNGQPYNQLGILAASRSDLLATLFYYVRAWAVKCSFPNAEQNTRLTFGRVFGQLQPGPAHGHAESSFPYANKALHSFLRFHASLFLLRDFDRLDELMADMAEYVPRGIAEMFLEKHSCQLNGQSLVQMAVIGLFMHWHVSNNEQIYGSYRVDDQRIVQLLTDHIGFLLTSCLQATPKQTQERRVSFMATLPAVRLLFEWLSSDMAHFKSKFFASSSLWAHLRKLLHKIQSNNPLKAGNQTIPDSRYFSTDGSHDDDGGDDDALKRLELYPLWEYFSVQAFIPFVPIYAGRVDFSQNKLREKISADEEAAMRCRHIMRCAIRVCQSSAADNLLTMAVDRPSRRIQFTAPATRVKLSIETTTVSPPPERKTRSSRNVAIQAILRNRTRQTDQDDINADNADGTVPRTKMETLNEKPKTGTSKIHVPVGTDLLSGVAKFAANGGVDSAPLAETPAEPVTGVARPSSKRFNSSTTVLEFGSMPLSASGNQMPVKPSSSATSATGRYGAGSNDVAGRGGDIPNLPPRFQALRNSQQAALKVDLVHPSIALLPESAGLGDQTPEEREYLSSAVRDLNNLPKTSSVDEASRTNRDSAAQKVPSLLSLGQSQPRSPRPVGGNQTNNGPPGFSGNWPVRPLMDCHFPSATRLSVDHHLSASMPTNSLKTPFGGGRPVGPLTRGVRPLMEGLDRPVQPPPAPVGPYRPRASVATTAAGSAVAAAGSLDNRAPAPQQAARSYSLFGDSTPWTVDAAVAGQNGRTDRKDDGNKSTGDQMENIWTMATQELGASAARTLTGLGFNAAASQSGRGPAYPTPNNLWTSLNVNKTGPSHQLAPTMPNDQIA